MHVTFHSSHKLINFNLGFILSSILLLLLFPYSYYLMLSHVNYWNAYGTTNRVHSFNVTTPKTVLNRMREWSSSLVWMQWNTLLSIEFDNATFVDPKVFLLLMQTELFSGCMICILFFRTYKYIYILKLAAQ